MDEPLTLDLWCCASALAPQIVKKRQSQCRRSQCISTPRRCPSYDPVCVSTTVLSVATADVYPTGSRQAIEASPDDVDLCYGFASFLEKRALPSASFPLVLPPATSRRMPNGETPIGLRRAVAGCERRLPDNRSAEAASGGRPVGCKRGSDGGWIRAPSDGSTTTRRHTGIRY